MSQDLRTISQEAFQLQLHKLSAKQLVKLISDIYDIKTTYGSCMNSDEAMDLERKETKINFELMTRGYLKKTDYESYFRWLKTQNYKKKVW